MIFRGANLRPFDEPFAGKLVAKWITGLGGTDWLNKLAEQGRAVALGGNGYPCRYVLTVEALLLSLRSGTPKATGPAVVGDDYYLPSNWTGNNSIELEVLQGAEPTELLVLEAWDQS